MKIERIIIIALFLYIVFLQMCSKPTIKIEQKEVIRTDSVHTRDTLINTVHIPVKTVSFVDRFVYKDDSTKIYHYGEKDSLLMYNIYIKSKCKPLDVKIEYDVNQFTIKDSIYVRDSVHTKEPIKSYLSLGASLSGSKNSFGVSPQLLYNHKRGASYGIGYDLINNNLNISFYKKISFKK